MASFRIIVKHCSPFILFEEYFVAFNQTIHSVNTPFWILSRLEQILERHKYDECICNEL
jgi:hypothetical protein